jgi:hypothetical protein
MSEAITISTASAGMFIATSAAVRTTLSVGPRR